jgi:hypothetical protein
VDRRSYAASQIASALLQPVQERENEAMQSGGWGERRDYP